MPEEVFEFSFPGPARIPFTQYIYDTISSEIIPFYQIKLTSKNEDKITNELFSPVLELDSEVKDTIMQHYKSDRLVCFYSVKNGVFGYWSHDMIISFDILISLGLMEPLDKWISNAHVVLKSDKKNIKNIQKLTAEQKPLLMELLNQLKITGSFNDQKKNTVGSIIRSTIQDKKIDYNTIIYRICMGVYHSRSATGESILKTNILDDPMQSYIDFVSGDFFVKHRDKFLPLVTSTGNLRGLIMKFLLSFLIGMYLYYEEVEKVDNS